MRKLLMIVFFAGLMVLVGCSSPPMFANASNHAQAIGTSAVSIADEFLDGTINAGRAYDRVRNLSTIEDVEVDGLLRVHVRSLGTRLLSYSIFSSSETFDMILEQRNVLAEGLGIDSR